MFAIPEPRLFARLAATTLLLAAVPRIGAAVDLPAVDEAVLVEMGEIKISAATILQREKSLLVFRKSKDPNFQPDEQIALQMRRDLALQELEFVLAKKFVAENKLTWTPEEADARLNFIKQKLSQSGTTFAQFLTHIGQTDEEFRTNDHAMQALDKKFRGEVTEAEIKKFFDEVQDEMELRRCSHILFMYKGAAQSEATRSKEEALKLAQDALAKAKAGDDFAKLAKEKSDCPSKKDGGDLDFSARKQVMNPESGRPENRAMLPAFSEALYKLEKPGSLSEVVETEYGYHILKLTAAKGFDDFKEKARAQLGQEKFDGFMQQQREQNASKIRFNEKLLGVTAKKKEAAPKEPAP